MVRKADLRQPVRAGLGHVGGHLADGVAATPGVDVIVGQLLMDGHVERLAPPRYRTMLAERTAPAHRRAGANANSRILNRLSIRGVDTLEGVDRQLRQLP